ncbi:MAG: DUF4870 domain-containing protein [Pseudoxanthomonas suwonensis]|nr:DUF4870 domain-containing protein [Pseudoxanthomonas suwonensis]
MSDFEQLPVASTTEPSVTERQWAAGAHVAALLAAFLTSWLVGVAGAVAALAVWVLVRDRYPFAAGHAREAVNFNLTMLIYAVVAFLLGLLLVGATVLTLGIGALVTLPAGVLLLLAVAAIALLWLVCGIIAAMKAYDGQTYRYPLTIRLFK